MKLTKARSMAKDLMSYYLGRGWSFRFDGGRRRFGLCSYRDMTISLSRHLVSLNEEARVLNTIMHEIAHALVGRGHRHNHVWRAKAMSIGCDGSRAYDHTEVVQLDLSANRKGREAGRHRIPR